MIELNLKGENQMIKSEPKDFTLRDLIEVSKIMKGKNNIESYVDVIEYLGGKDLANVISSKDVIFFANHMNVNNITDESKETITVNGKVYKANVVAGKVDISARELVVMEKIIKTNDRFEDLIFALLYKEDGISKLDSLNMGHIKKKASIFLDNVTCDIATPPLIQVFKEMVNSVDEIRNSIVKG